MASALWLLRVTAMCAVVATAPTRAVGQDREPELLVLAASSLTDVLPRIAAAWLEAGGVPVSFSFDATSRLAPQAVEDGLADLFFSADSDWMRWLAAQEKVAPGAARAVAGNTLVAVVPRGAGAPGNVRALVGLSRIGLAGENVPAGRYARSALTAAGVWGALEPKIVRGGSARSVLEWVARGEVDVGVVYGTDAAAEPRVAVAFTFPAGSHEPIRYWGATLADAPHAPEADAFLNFAGGPEAAAILVAHGFDRVPEPDRQVTSSGPDPVAGRRTATGGGPSISSAIRLSLIVALVATLVGLVPAVGLGWVLARREFRGKTIVSTLVLVPLVIPPVVTGFLLLSVLGRQTLIGGWLAALGLPVPFTLLGAAIAALVVGLPLYVISVRGAFEAVDPQYEEVAWTLGAPPRKAFFRVSLPLALPGIAAGAILAFARSLGEFGATVVLAGNVEGSTRTIALAVFTLMESPTGRGATWSLVGASVALSLIALLGFESLTRRQRARLEDRHGR